MKAQYEALEIEVIQLETDDIIVTSNGEPGEGELD